MNIRKKPVKPRVTLTVHARGANSLVLLRLLSAQGSLLRWVCYTPGLYGYGVTPAQAYARWAGSVHAGGAL